MPEGSEVKNLTDRLVSLDGRVIKSAKVISGRYMRAPLDLSALKGAQLSAPNCHGKLMWFHIITAKRVPMVIMSTLGMTGDWDIDREPDMRKHVRILIELDGGSELVFMDQRNFGTFKIVEPSEFMRKLRELGPDILTRPELYDTVVQPFLRERISRFCRAMPLAEALLDQRIFAGCGNYIRADAMYMGEFNPRRMIRTLNHEELRVLWTWLHRVAIAALADEHLILGRPYAYVSPCYGSASAYYGQEVVTYEDRQGRTVHWCPERQTR